LALSLKAERKKSEVLIQDLRSQIQENDAVACEKDKLELVESFMEIRGKHEEQQQCIKEFVDINQNLIFVAQSKENKVMLLKSVM
jgi:hypothetical protein